MELMHFSNATEIHVESKPQPPHRTLKPVGLWVSDESVEDSWSTWCQAENFEIGWNGFTVKLASDAQVLTLTTPYAIREFDVAYATGYYVDWARVAQRYQGILITPYQWSLRLSDVHWYYAWDCASGCIWDAAAVASVAPVEPAVPAQE